MILIKNGNPKNKMFCLKAVILSQFLLVNIAFAAETKNIPSSDKSTAINSQSTNDDLNILLGIPDVKKKFDECKKALGDQIAAKEIPKCIWEGNEDNKIEKLDDKTKALVQEEYKKLQKNNDNKLDLTNSPTNISSTYRNHPGFQKLSDLVGKRIQDALSGPNEKDKIAAVDHTAFNDLYRAELSKGIVDALSNYCMKVDYSKGPGVASEGCIKECKLVRDAADPKDEYCEKVYCAYYSFKDKDEADKNAKENLDKLNNGEKINVDQCMASVPAACISISDVDSEAKRLACVTDDFLKASRKSLLLNDKLTKVYQDPSLVGNGLDIKNMGKNASINKEKLVTVTSADIEKTYTDSNKELLKETEKCTNDPSLPECSKLLDTNRDDKNAAVAEFGLRQFVQEDNLNKELENKDTLNTYLLGEGFSKEQIDKLLTDDEKIKEIKERIKAKFKDKKNALISELSERVRATTSSKDGKITADPTDQTRVQSIYNELQGKTDNLKNLARFNNIASAYLNVGDKNARDPSSTKANVVSLQAELNSGNKDKADANKKIQDAFKDQLSNGNTSNDNLNILDTIRDILGF